MKNNTFFVALALLGLFVANSRAVIVLQSVDWNSSVGSSLSGTWSFGSLTGTTGTGVTGAGAVLNVGWGGMPYGVGYTTSINEGVVLAAANNSTATQSFSFSSNVSSIYLFFAWVDNGTSFDFGSYNWTLVGANSAYRSGGSVVISGSSDQQTNGFLINVNETFGPGNDFVFNFINPTFTGTGGGHTVGFNLAQGAPQAVPEPGTWVAAALLVGAAGYVRWRRRIIVD